MKKHTITKADIERHIVREKALLAMPPVAVSKENFDEMLNVLPPNNFTGDSFTMSEMTSGRITTQYATMTVEGLEHYICKQVEIENGQVTAATRITGEDFVDLDSECLAIAEIEAKIYGEENTRTMAAVQYVMENYTSGIHQNLISAYKMLEETGAAFYGSAADCAYDHLEGTSPHWDAIEPLFCYMDHKHYLQDQEIREVGYEVWIDTQRLGCA